LPANVSFYQVDFSQQSLAELARVADINFNIPTTIIWEGVSNYLSAEAVAQTFEFAGRFTAGSGIIFTYIDQLVLDKPQAFYGVDKIHQTLSKAQEKWTLGFKPDELGSYLQKFGLTLIENTSATEYRNKYMPERKAISRGYEFYRVALAVKK
jgi:O-methyltransferase involved in polyketide biosynthesis